MPDLPNGAQPAPASGVDPNASIPPNVRAAAAAADAAHAAAYGPQPQPAAPPNPQGTVQFAEPTYVPSQPATRGQPWVLPPNYVPPPINQPAPQSQSAPQPSPQPVNPDRATWTPEQWNHYAASMEGRLRKSQEQITQLQEATATLGDEVARATAVRQPVQPPQPPKKLLTPQDEEVYGRDMLDLVRRAAIDTVSPVITDLRKQNQALQQRINSTAATGIEAQLDAQVPDWRTINKSSSFRAWLSLRDIYSRKVRQQLLNDAYAAGDAASVAAFFRGYLQENPNEAQGSLDNPLLYPPPGQPQVRQATVPLQSLTAPGHAQPPSGSQPYMDAGAKPIISHAQIAKFYENCRLADQGKGPYVGRATDRANDEQFIFECQREGRVR